MKNTKRNKMASVGKRQYVLTLIVTLFAIWAIVSYTFLSFYAVARQDAVALGEKSVVEQSERLNNFLLMGLDVLQVTGLTVDYMMQNGCTSEEIEHFLLKESEEYTKHIDANYTGIYGLFDGEYIDGIGWVPDEGFEPKSRPWYTAAIEGNGKPVIVSPYLDAQTNSVMISVSQMLSDGESVISLDIVMDEMQEFAEGINLNGKGYGFIIDDTGLVVAHSDVSQKGCNYITDDNMQGTDMQEIVKRVISNGGQTISIRIDGKDSRVFSKQIQDDWYVVMIINVHDLFQEVESTFVVNILVSLVIFVVVAYFCTANYKNRAKAIHYANELEHYQLTLEDRIAEQTSEIKKQTEQMISMQEHTVEGMATLIESRDGNTGEHVKSTKRYVSMIAGYMYKHELHKDEITKDYIKKLANAATLHDVGKIKISDVVLNKPGKFTPEEYEVMKTHTTIGGDIVRDVLGEDADEDMIKLAKNVALYHHEKWDGSGYPCGLKGEEIPLSARIMAVADVFDALVSKRVYKESMTIDEAFDILKKDSGTHFDPEIVDVFIKVRPYAEEYLDKLRASK